MIRVSVVNARTLRGFRRSDQVRRLGLKCYKCGRQLRYGEKVVVRGPRSPKYYCVRCAKQLLLI